MSKCGYGIAWVGDCKNENPCKEHKDIKCFRCKNKATRECCATMQFVCGAPICSNCKCHWDG